MAKTTSKNPSVKLVDGDHDLTFLEQLRIFRDRQGWTNEDLGKRLGLTGRSVCNIFMGVQNPSEASCLLLIALKNNPKMFDEYLFGKSS